MAPISLRIVQGIANMTENRSFDEVPDAAEQLERPTGAQQDRHDRTGIAPSDQRDHRDDRVEGRDTPPPQRPPQDSPWMGGG
jgi:hypothetical protein